MTATVTMGVQTPRICHTPVGASYDLADDALDWLREVVGFELDEWQRLILRESLAESRPGRWAATEIGVVVSRQNGKGAILEARELIGLFLLNELLLIHSAHQYKTAQEHFLRVVARIEEVPELRSRLRAGGPKGGIRTAAGEQGVILKSGARLRFLARKGGSGRGFSAPFVAFDEAMDLPEPTVADMAPTQSAMPRRQRWYTGSAVDQMEQQNGVVLARVRERGIRGDEARLAFFEWSLDVETPDLLEPALMLDDGAIAAANPGYGIRITREAVEDETHSLSPRSVAVERFGVGDWPATDGGRSSVIDAAAWLALTDRESRILDPVGLVFDVAPDRSWASVGAAGYRGDGMAGVEVIEHRRGTGWLVGRLVELAEAHGLIGIGCDAAGPAASLLDECAAHGLEVEAVSAAEHAKACGLLLDRVNQATVRHMGQPELNMAVKGAAKRPLGDAWAWSRKNSGVDISPLVACTLALGQLLAFVDEPGGVVYA